MDSDSCYSSAYHGAASASIDVVGQLKNNLYLPTDGAECNVTAGVAVRFNVSSDCAGEGLLNESITSLEMMGPSSQIWGCTPIYNETTNQGWYNCTWDSTDREEGYWSIRLNSSRTYYNDNSTTYNDWL